MTFQPPPPPPQGPPPQGPPPQGPPPQGPPPGQWGPPPGQSGGSGGGGFDPKSVNQLDWGILAAGFLAFIFSFVSLLHRRTVTVGGRSIDVSGGSASAWHEVLAAASSAGSRCCSRSSARSSSHSTLFMPHVKLPFPNRLVGLGAVRCGDAVRDHRDLRDPGGDAGFGGASSTSATASASGPA